MRVSSPGRRSRADSSNIFASMATDPPVSAKPSRPVRPTPAAPTDWTNVRRSIRELLYAHFGAGATSDRSEVLPVVLQPALLMSGGIEIGGVQPGLVGFRERRPLLVDDREPRGIAIAALEDEMLAEYA